MARIFGNLRLILDDGARRGVFRPMNPLHAYLTLLSPVIFFRATAPIRAALVKLRLVDAALADPQAFIATLKSTATAVLAAPRPPRARAPRRRSRATRPGDRA